MIDIITFTTFAIIILVCLYIVVNLYKKCDNLEQWVDSTYVAISNTLTEMQKIDSTGHFEADDEVGVIFTQLKNQLLELEKITEE